MPRLSLKKFFFSAVGAVSTLFFVLLQISSHSVLYYPFLSDKYNNNNLYFSGPFGDEAPRLVNISLTRPWFMTHGLMEPKFTSLPLWPEDTDFGNDRIFNQLMFLSSSKGSLPLSTENNKESSGRSKLKKILLWSGFHSWSGVKAGRSVFLNEKCPIHTCSLSYLRSESVISDLVIFKDHYVRPVFRRPADQLWMMYMLECPFHSQVFSEDAQFNWTATYRSDSTIVTPYEKWMSFSQFSQSNTVSPTYNVGANKTKAVAWFVSNCGARNKRLEYARELQKYINVDIYGACGDKKCPRLQSESCFEMLNSDYRFYLAFENSNCVDYITEKFFVNGLKHNVLPIVMGARPEDYKRSAPSKSYIHVDDFSGPAELASYLHLLESNDSLYNEYFAWKGTGEFINTKFFCRVCALLHEKRNSSSVSSIPMNDWWRKPGTCINGSWKKYKEALEREAYKNSVNSVK